MKKVTDGKRIVLTGYFSRGNLGDDAMIEGLVSYLRDGLPGHAIALVPFPSSTSITALPGFIGTLRSADWVVLAGGTNLHDAYGFKSWRLLSQIAALFLVARASGTKVAYCGIGIGPLDTHPGRVLTRWLLGLSHSSTVRDANSLRQAESLRPGSAAPGFDLAFLNSPPPPRQEVTQGRRIGVSLVAYHTMYGLDGARDDQMLDSLAWSLIEHASALQIDGVEIYPFSRSGVYSDISISLRFAQRLRGALDVEIVDCGSPAVVRQRLPGLRAFIGARFHSIVLAYEAGLPIIPMIYHEKCAALVAELQLGPRTALTPAHFTDRSRASELVLRLASAPDEYRARLSLEEARENARRTAALLVSAIEGEKHETDQSALGAALSGVRRAA